MEKPFSYTLTRPRYPFANRPWITGKLYDDMSRTSILHCDAYAVLWHGREYLVIDWREGGKVQVALDAWLIERDGLTPVWDARRVIGKPVYWSALNSGVMARVHRTVLQLAQDMGELYLGLRWTRVMVQAHYVMVREADPEISANKYAGHKPYAARSPFPDIL